jgi:hypothetical protein
VAPKGSLLINTYVDGVVAEATASALSSDEDGLMETGGFSGSLSVLLEVSLYKSKAFVASK